jgi:acetylornithine/succinyldiaminopimelate/putrescine aminotransferase
VLDVVERDGLVGHAAEMGEHLHASLQDLGAREVRGVGLMQAFQFAEPRAKPLQQACLERGLIVNAVDDHTVRLVPPLVITAQQIDRAHELMLEAMR